MVWGWCACAVDVNIGNAKTSTLITQWLMMREIHQALKEEEEVEITKTEWPWLLPSRFGFCNANIAVRRSKQN